MKTTFKSFGISVLLLVLLSVSVSAYSFIDSKGSVISSSPVSDVKSVPVGAVAVIDSFSKANIQVTPAVAQSWSGNDFSQTIEVCNRDSIEQYYWIVPEYNDLKAIEFLEQKTTTIPMSGVGLVCEKRDVEVSQYNVTLDKNVTVTIKQDVCDKTYQTNYTKEVVSWQALDDKNYEVISGTTAKIVYKTPYSIKPSACVTLKNHYITFTSQGKYDVNIYGSSKDDYTCIGGNTCNFVYKLDPWYSTVALANKRSRTLEIYNASFTVIQNNASIPMLLNGTKDAGLCTQTQCWDYIPTNGSTYNLLVYDNDINTTTKFWKWTRQDVVNQSSNWDLFNDSTITDFSNASLVWSDYIFVYHASNLSVTKYGTMSAAQVAQQLIVTGSIYFSNGTLISSPLEIGGITNLSAHSTLNFSLAPEYQLSATGGSVIVFGTVSGAYAGYPWVSVFNWQNARNGWAIGGFEAGGNKEGCDIGNAAGYLEVQIDTYEAGVYKMLGCVWNSTTLMYYKNGHKVGETPLTFPPTYSPVIPLFAGTGAGGTGSPTYWNINTSIDEIFLANRTMSDTEIAMLWEQGKDIHFVNGTTQSFAPPSNGNISVLKVAVTSANASQVLLYQINVTSVGAGSVFNLTINDTYSSKTTKVSTSPAPNSSTATTDSWLVLELPTTAVFSINITVMVMNVSNGTVLNNTINATFTNSSSYTFRNDTVIQTSVFNAPPNCTLISRSPANITDNSTGLFVVMINCTDNTGLNVSNLDGHYWGFATRTIDGMITQGVPNAWSIRPPENNLAVADPRFTGSGYAIWRAQGRNRGFWYELLGLNTTINNDTYSYAIDDGRYYLNISAQTSTSAILNYTAQSEWSFYRQNAPLDWQSMANETKKNFTITSTNPVLIKTYDLEAIRGADNYTIYVYANLADLSLAPRVLRMYYCNNSYDPTGIVQVIASPVCTAITTRTPAQLTPAWSYKNSSYVKLTYGINNRSIGGIKATNISYLYFDTSGGGGTARIRYVNGTTITNDTFKDTKKSWTSTNTGTTWTQRNWTADVIISSIDRNADDEFEFGIFVQDLQNSVYSNFSFFVDDINPTDHPISSPSIIAYNSSYNPNDFARNGTQKGIMNILVGVARDPDQTGNVEMNLTLRNLDGTWNFTINTTFNSSTDADLWLNFDTNLVPDGKYKMNISAFSYTRPADYKSFLTEPNFTINNTPTLDTCGSIVANGTTYLVANITTATTCINILYDNVTLDCGGNSITFGTGYLPSETFGVKAMDRINITVKNCFVFAGILGGSLNGTGFMGISYRNVTGGRIENNTIITNNYYGYGIDLRGSNFNTLRGNKLFK